MSVLLKNAVWLKPDLKSWTTGDLAVLGNKIALPGDYPEDAHFDEIIDCTDKVVIPGLINSHAHSYTAYLKGTIDNVPLDIYMLYAIAGGSFRSEREIYVSSALEAISMLKTGTSSVVDHFSQRPVLSAEGLDATAAAFSRAGLRTRIATMYADKGFFETLPLMDGELPAGVLPAKGGASLSIDEYIDVVEKAYLKYRSDPLIHITLGTDGPQRCSDELLIKTGELENKYKMGWETHILEAKTQAIVSNSFYGKGLIEHMSELGILNERTALVHHVWVSDRELQCVAESGASVVHCPTSNLHLGSGVAPADRYRDMGIHLALGSDGGNCGSTGMLEQIKALALLHNVSQTDYEKWFSAEDALNVDYSGGRYIFGEDIGRICTGALADLTIIDIDNILWQPVNNLTRQLVYYENGSNVDTVIVNGEIVLKNGVSTRFNEKELMAEAGEICEKLRRDCADNMALVEKQIPYIRKMYLREINRDIGFNRFIR